MPSSFISNRSVILDHPLTVRLWITQPAFGVEKWLWTLNWVLPGADTLQPYQEVHEWANTEEEAKQEAFAYLCYLMDIPSEQCRQLLDDYQQRLALTILGNM